MMQTVPTDDANCREELLIMIKFVFPVCVCPQWAMRQSTGLCTGDIWSSMSLNQSSLSFMVRFLHIPALVCIKPQQMASQIPEDTWITASNWTFVSAPLHHSGTHNLVLRIVFFPLCSLCRLISRCTVAFKENHRPQELRVPHVEAGRVPGVPSGREDGTPQSPFLIIRTVPVVRHNDALSETSAC